MYRITKIKENGLTFITLHSADNNANATFCLEQGGRLSALAFDKISILADLNPDTYAFHFASAILFPFANRIKDGKYAFEGSNYELSCNEVDKNNALHGLVYDQIFECIDHTLCADSGSITLVYKYDGTIKGFPFKFDIILLYTLRNKSLNLTVKIINQDHKTYPFTLGWHPYFKSKDLDLSAITFQSKTMFSCDHQQIVSGTVPFDMKIPYQLNDVKLDDGYVLESDSIKFCTPEYTLEMKMSAKENFLQLYTPSLKNCIAIEPMTGAADSFNNKIGLQTIKSNESYSTLWHITFKKPLETTKTNHLIT